MYPPRFDYVAPASVDEVLALLEEHSDDAKILAGGQSLIPVLKLRFASPDIVVDVNNIDELRQIRKEGDELVIGSMVKHCTLADNAELAPIFKVITEAGHWVADPIVRNLGTIGGSLVHADPRGDWATVMLALDATVVIRSTEDTRHVKMTDFLVGMFTTDIEAEEFLTEIRIKLPQGRSGGTYIKMERRIGDYATAAAAVHLELNNGVMTRVGIGLTAVNPTNMKCAQAEQILIGQAPSPALFDQAADAAAAACNPEADVRGSAAYKRAVVRSYVRRGLQEALDQAQA